MGIMNARLAFGALLVAALLAGGCASSQSDDKTGGKGGKSGASGSPGRDSKGADSDPTVRGRGGDAPAGDRSGKFGDVMNGYGAYLYENGDKYLGDFKDGKRHGSGTMLYTNGDQYKGQWEDDEKHGEGVYRYVNGDEFEGTFEKGKRSGLGVYRFEDGHQFEGNFSEDGVQGTGVLTEVKTKNRQECEIRKRELFCKPTPGEAPEKKPSKAEPESKKGEVRKTEPDSPKKSALP